MDNELQQLLRILYGDRKMDERALASYTKQWDTDHNGFRTIIRNAASDKIKQQAPVIVNSKAAQVKPTLVSVQHDAENIKPIEPKRATNDMSAITDFKQAFRQARQGGHKNFFWKKTKANPSGMFNTNYAEQSNQDSKQSASPKQGIDQLMFKAAETLPQQQSALEKQLMQPASYPFTMDDIARDSKILALKNIIPNPKGNPGTYVNGNTSKYSTGGNIQEQSSTPLIGNSGASIADVITVINSKDMNAIQELFSSIGQEGFEQAIRGIQQMAKEGDGSAIQALQTLQKLMQGSQKAKLGTKLNYIHKLKGNCPEGEELVYMKQGGRVCPVCQKKAEKAKYGKELPEKNAVADFKEKRKHINPNDTVNTKFGPRDLNGKTKYPKYNAKKENYDFETRMRVQEKDEKSGKKVIGSACGSKMNKKK